MPTIVRCNHCGVAFSQDVYKARRNKENYCSLECRRQWQSREKKSLVGTYVCEQCGKSFERPRYEAVRQKNHFCSYVCSRKFITRRVKVNCSYCGKEIEQKVSEIAKNKNQFCSYACNAAHRNTRQVVNCDYCGNPVTRKNKEIVNLDHHFCGKPCWNKWHVGTNVTAWRGGKAAESYPAGFDNDLKKYIRHRDRHYCHVCGKTRNEEGQELAVHHIDYNKKNLSHANLLTVCKACNSRVNHKRSEWQAKLEAYQKSRGIS